jgi:hypothetical protein
MSNACSIRRARIITGDAASSRATDDPRGAMILAAIRLRSREAEAADKGEVSAPLPWLCLTRDWRLAVGSGLVPSIPVFRSVRDYSQHAQCSTVPT